MLTFLYTIYDGKMKEVQTVRATNTEINGTIVIFYFNGESEMVYNLPPGFSITAELVED